ncbi:DNA polymerase/3'-5' exonuclease PolX [Methylocystis hirsuta]|uniref:DNA polymerase beta n=1 Tax=Methylocystis hirsuta TaxID=369798 RepID=A0A3M9XIW5_9HYPH|nr:DNA polymerase/3'-5' exonuclease PolX [Methylocystis hirsuta]RNJ48103.1 DNA polymerase/3'-5' exonuclease PolX [Methylocystis hirsuta]
MPVHNAEIAEMFDQTAELLEIKGDNPFRTRAYRRAARVLEGLPKSAAAMLSAGEDLAELPGIGHDLAGKIASIVETGKFDVLQSLKRELPGDLGEIVAIPGLGPKRVKVLIDELGVRSIEDVRRAVKSGRLNELRGFGPKLQKNIAAALAKPVAVKRFKLPFAEAEATALIEWLRGGLDGGQVVVAGSFRRRRDTVGDLDVLATSANAAAVGDRLAHYENVAQVIAHGPTRTTVVLRSGIQVDLRVVEEKSYGAALLYFTGSKAHNIALRNIAVDRGWKLNEYGLFSKTRSIAGAPEAEIYKKLGLQFVPPELREDRGEIALAQKNALPKLVQLSDIRGDLHVHSNWSDGDAPIAEMAQAARARGYEYMALTDHSRRVTVAHGLDRARLLRQIREVDRLNGKLRGFTVLKGVEVDILADGSLDLPDEVLSRLDIVVAAVHYKFDLPRDEQTERIIRAMDNPRVSVLAHPTGRLIEERGPYDIDVDRVMKAAKERGCCLELNAEPDRLDLTDVAAKAAKALGVKIAISTDAHSTAGLAYMRYGVDQARRGWLEPDDVINTRPLRELKKLIRR